MERRLFNSGDKIAPGLYMRYWDAIVKKRGGEQLMANDLKQYREMRSGAILAALWTNTTGEKYFVSLPSREPADVEIFTLVPAEFKGKPSYRLARVPVQLTRCSLPDGETIVEQIMKKNKPALKDVTLVVHVEARDGDVLELNSLVKEVQAIKPLYPKEIAIITPIADPSSAEQTFGQVLLSSEDSFGKMRSSTVNLGDKSAFFTNPSVMRSQLGTGQAITVAGDFSLMLP